MRRISQSNIDRVVARLNETTGNPSEPWREVGSAYRANVGNYHCSIENGGVAVEQIVEGGGTTKIIDRGTKREVYEKLHALLDGIEIGRKASPSGSYCGTCGRSDCNHNGTCF